MNFPKPAVGMLPNDRLDYSAINTRKALKLPGKARMVVDESRKVIVSP